MAKIHFIPEHKDVLDSALLPLPEVKPGKMFGCPAYYIHGKMFACLFTDGIILKLPESQVNTLIEEGTAVPFEPKGRGKMREWVKLEVAEANDYLVYQDLFSQSSQFVAEINQS